MKKVLLGLLGAFFILVLSFEREGDVNVPYLIDTNDSLRYIPPSPQKIGDSKKGRDYLIYGDYVSSGLPYSLFMMSPQKSDNHLKREGINGPIPYNFTATKHANGAKIVAPNCLQCHAGFLRDSFIFGLGNSVGNFTIDPSQMVPGASFMISQTFGSDSREMEAYESFKTAVQATGPYLTTEVIGANPADQLTALLAAHRDPVTLEWRDSMLFEVPNEVIPTDVPPWWVLKKKNAMFYTGIGRGDFAKYLMGSSLFTLKDSSEAAAIYPSFADVLAFLRGLEAPKYPGEIDMNKAAIGQVVFDENCSKCHGIYGEKEKYPNLLVPLSIVGTDPLLSNAYQSSYGKQLTDWFNRSWFSRGNYKPRLVAEGGYVAQPLDGIWASAPYLHNGSVPDLETLLNSRERPEKWRRVDSTDRYDLEKVGWKYVQLEEKEDVRTYDTTIPGYGNMGHRFGDKLTSQERDQVIEYLKTL